MTCRIKIIIPVYQGARQLGPTLATLAAQVSGNTAVAVVMNGPRDRSYEVARAGLKTLAAQGAITQLVEIARPSRPAALTAGDRSGPQSGHRLYLDQDAILSPGALQNILAALEDGADFVAGVAEWRGGSFIVRSAMRAWNALPYVRRSPATAGMYALSARGRARWNEWPEGFPDDKFARMHFHLDERRRLNDVRYSVEAPTDFRALTLARRRYRTSNRVLRQGYPELMTTDKGRSVLANLGLAPCFWPGAAILMCAEMAGMWQRTR